MADTIQNLTARPALPAGERLYDDVLRLAVESPRTTIRLQLAPKSQKSPGKLRIAGQPLPEAMNSGSGDDPVIARIAPDTWLLVSGQQEAAGLMEAVRAGCARQSFAATDLSDAHATIAVEGPRAIELLARGCGLDMASLAAEACTRTRFAQLPIVLRRAAGDRYELIVDSAAVRYLFDWLQDAAAGLD
jgi:heterotetrameric sarcosine oxidase gamma subunit